MAVPKIRFPGFTEDWEQRKLGEISEKVTTKNQDMVVNEVFTNSAEYGIISQQDFFDKDIANSNKVDGYYLVEPDDFVYNPRISNSAPFGPIKRNKLGRSGAMSPLYYVFRSHDVDKSYLDWFFQTNRWHAFMRFHGNTGVRSDRFAITDKIFAEMTISIPQDIDEQKAIGTFFTALDDSITLHQRKLESMKLLKKSLLQKMFPKSGETVPEVRFPGFTDAWEQRKLADIGGTYTGLSGKKASDFGHGDARFVTYMNIYKNTVATLSGTELIEIDAKQHEVKYGDVFFTTSSETPEEVAMSSIWLGNQEHTYLNSFCFGFRPEVDIDPFFLAYTLRAPTFRSDAIFLAQGISRYNISKNRLMEVRIGIPSSKEQKKIGELFRSLDQTITLHQRKVEILHKLKKSLLQQMFV